MKLEPIIQTQKEKHQYCTLTHKHGIQKDGTSDPKCKTERHTDVKNRLLDYVGEGEGGMICKKSIETCILPYVKELTSSSLMHETGHSKLVLWDNPEGQGGEEDEREVQDGGTRVQSWLIHVDVWQNHHNTVK